MSDPVLSGVRQYLDPVCSPVRHMMRLILERLPMIACIECSLSGSLNVKLLISADNYAPEGSDCGGPRSGYTDHEAGRIGSKGLGESGNVHGRASDRKSASWNLPVVYANRVIGEVNFRAANMYEFDSHLKWLLSLYTVLLGQAAGITDATFSGSTGRYGCGTFARLRHLARIPKHAFKIACYVGRAHGYRAEFAHRVTAFSPLVDLGATTSDESWRYPMRLLTPATRQAVSVKVDAGLRIVDEVTETFGLKADASARVLRNIVAYRYERSDGSGNPLGLSGVDVPLEARIVAVADIFDSLTDSSCGQRACTFQEAIGELSKGVAEGRIDALCVSALENG